MRRKCPRLLVPHRKTLVLLLLPLILFTRPVHKPNQQPTLATLPIHQISLSSLSPAPQTTNIASSTTLHPTLVPQHIASLPANTVIFLTAGCVQASANAHELLYLALLHHKAPAVVPALRTPPYADRTLSNILPIVFRASVIQPHKPLEQSLLGLHLQVLEIPAAIAKSSCNTFVKPFDRTFITNRSSRLLPKSIYGDGTETLRPPPIAPIPFTPSKQHPKTILFAMPWIQMGGSEQCILRLARYAKSKGFRTSFVLTKPFWGETNGLLVTKNDWIDRAYEITDHVLDLVNVAPFQHRAKLLRYYLETLRPGYIVTANSRLFYSFLPFARAILKDLVVADYNHMVHTDWLGGGMPRYGANNTEFIDRHFAASENVTNAIKDWVKDDGYDDGKAQTCYIGTDVDRFHTGFRKQWVKHVTRTRLGISNTKVLILFAGRFVLDKGIDVLTEVIPALKSDSRFAFLLVGSGALEDMVLPLTEPGRVVVKPSATFEEMTEYYAASDVLLLPSVKEGIALVLYEAMANRMLVISTDVGGQSEVITPERGVLLQRGPTEQVAGEVKETLHDYVSKPAYYRSIRQEGQRIVRERYTTERFCECVFRGMMEARKERRRDRGQGFSEAVMKRVGDALKDERVHGVWSWRVYPQSVGGVLTIGRIGGCRNVDRRHVENAGNVTVVHGDSLADIAGRVDTELMITLPVGYSLRPDTDLQKLVNVVRRPLKKLVFDMIGVRIKRQSGPSRLGRLIEDSDGVSLCWVGNVEEITEQSTVMKKSLDGANVVDMNVEILKMEMLDEVYVVRTERLKQVLGKFGEMSSRELFVKGFNEGWTVGYAHGIVVDGECDSGKVPMLGVSDGGMCEMSKQKFKVSY